MGIKKAFDDIKLLDLINRAREKDLSAIQAIIEQHKKKIYFIAYDICGDQNEAEDISQEVFIKIFRFIGSFKFDAKFSSWVYQIAVNTAIDLVRKRKRQIFMENAEMESLLGLRAETGGRSDNPETLTLQELLRQKIRIALLDLSKREQAVFLLRYFNQLKYAEISEILKISENTIKTLLFRGKKKLRKKLASHYQDNIFFTSPEVRDESM